MSFEGQSERLRALAQGAREAGQLALDTEFMGEGRYRTLLCLVQLATPQAAGMAERIELLDPLERDIDPAPLAGSVVRPWLRCGPPDGSVNRRAIQQTCRSGVARVLHPHKVCQPSRTLMRQPEGRRRAQ